MYNGRPPNCSILVPMNPPGVIKKQLIFCDKAYKSVIISAHCCVDREQLCVVEFLIEMCVNLLLSTKTVCFKSIMY